MAIYRKPATRPTKPSTPVSAEEDAFVAATVRATNWAKRNTTLLVLLLVVVGAAVVSLVYYSNYREALQAQAAAQLESLQQRIDVGQQDGVRADLEVFLERYGNTSLAGEARLALAQALVGEGDPGAAAQVLEPMAGDVSRPLGAQAAALLAPVFEDLGNHQGAEALYLRLADRGDLGFHANEALLAAARLRQARGDHEGALALYDRLLESPEELGPNASLVELRRAEAAAALR